MVRGRCANVNDDSGRSQTGRCEATGSSSPKSFLRKFVRKPRVLVTAAAAFAVFAATYLFWVFLLSSEDMKALDGLTLRQEAHITRLWEHCAAHVDGDEGSSLSTDVWTLQSIVVLGSHGDSSPLATWPGESADSSKMALFDCSPKDLPRHWRLNQRIDFQVVDRNGVRLNRSFTPEFTDETVNVCAPGQLTGSGFRQAVTTGRYLGNVYDSFLTELASKGDMMRRVYVRSMDTQRSLASAVGITMALLASPESVEVFGHGTELSVRVDQGGENALANDKQQDLTTGDWALGDHLLARWCHRLPWPCGHGARFVSNDECVSDHRGAQLISSSEAAVCGGVPPERVVSFLAQVRRMLYLKKSPSIAIFSADGPVLSATMVALLGRQQACADPLMARPPFSSRVVFERWTSSSHTGPSSSQFRVLWNGEDVTARILGCSLIGGCDESIIDTRLST
eukprot:TRINITY_DN30482_c0_g1_i1.p1 TRINITY_DN30482_c0_g1~~TRINITY_DN30482_c0_g1_i1.p1  ORF type:complete len:453 (+),score=53.96 TRINITY_DN30482_c0_g1_i1:74-1432(+)